MYVDDTYTSSQSSGDNRKKSLYKFEYELVTLTCL